MTLSFTGRFQSTIHQLRHWLARVLVDWGEALQPTTPAEQSSPGVELHSSNEQIPDPTPPTVPQQTVKSSPVTKDPPPLDSLCPGVREPISVEDAVLHRDMSVLKREAADALAALGASHALITSARLAQVQRLRPEGESGGVTSETLMAIAADYQGWQNDQVRLFDALSLIMRMRVPQGLVLDQMDPALHGQARSHLEALSLEYSRRQLMDRFQAS